MDQIGGRAVGPSAGLVALLPTSCPTFKRPRPYTAIAGDFRCLPGLTAFFRIAVGTAGATGRVLLYEECSSRAATNKQEVWTLHGMAPGASIGNIFETKAGTQCMRFIRQQRDQMRTSVARGLKAWQADDLATALLIAKFYDLLSRTRAANTEIIQATISYTVFLFGGRDARCASTLLQSRKRQA